MKTRQISIYSWMARKSWSGTAELSADDQQALEEIWRQFNRVDRADVQRLQRIGYNLPSLSVGDRVTLDDVDYWVNDLAWTKERNRLPEYIKGLQKNAVKQTAAWSTEKPGRS